MVNVKNIADEADMIINGYVFRCSPEGFRVLNLNCPDKAVVLSMGGLELSQRICKSIKGTAAGHPLR